MTTYGACIAYFSVGFFIGVLGLATDADRQDDFAATASWLAAWTLLSPIMLLLAVISFTLEKFSGIPKDFEPIDDDDDENPQ